MDIGGRLVGAGFGLAMIAAAISMVRYREQLFHFYRRDGWYPVPRSIHDVWHVICAAVLGTGGAAVVGVALLRSG